MRSYLHLWQCSRHHVALPCIVDLQDGRALDEMAIAEALVLMVHQTRCSNCMIWAKSDAVVRRLGELSPGEQALGYRQLRAGGQARWRDMMA